MLPPKEETNVAHALAILSSYQVQFGQPDFFEHDENFGLEASLENSCVAVCTDRKMVMYRNKVKKFGSFLIPVFKCPFCD